LAAEENHLEWHWLLQQMPAGKKIWSYGKKRYLAITFIFFCYCYYRHNAFYFLASYSSVN